MKILFCAPVSIRKHNLDFSFWNFVLPLKSLGHDVFLFDYRVNGEVSDHIETIKPDLIFCIATGHEGDQFFETIFNLKDKVFSINLFADDSWRFDNFSSIRSECFSLNLTTELSCVDKYRFSVKYTTWPVNNDLFEAKRMVCPKNNNFLFYGYINPSRATYLNAIHKSGRGPVTRLSGDATYEEVVAAACSSHCILNFTADSNYIQGKEPVHQSKARVFEALACNSLLITETYPDLSHHLAIDECLRFTHEHELLLLMKKVVENLPKAEYVAGKGHEKYIEKYEAKKVLTEILNEY